VNGGADAIIYTVNSFILQQNIPNAQLILYPDANHGSLYQIQSSSSGTPRFPGDVTAIVGRSRPEDGHLICWPLREDRFVEWGSSPARAASITCSRGRRGSRRRCPPRSLAWAGGRL